MSYNTQSQTAGPDLIFPKSDDCPSPVREWLLVEDNYDDTFSTTTISSPEDSPSSSRQSSLGSRPFAGIGSSSKKDSLQPVEPGSIDVRVSLLADTLQAMTELLETQGQRVAQLDTQIWAVEAQLRQEFSEEVQKVREEVMHLVRKVEMELDRHVDGCRMWRQGLTETKQDRQQVKKSSTETMADWQDVEESSCIIMQPRTAKSFFGVLTQRVRIMPW